MRPHTSTAVAAIAAATGIRAGRVTHAARQLQQAGMLPTSVGRARCRLRPAQVAMLVIAAVMDVPIRSIAQAALSTFRLRDEVSKFGDRLADVIEFRRHTSVAIDLDGAWASIQSADAPTSMFGQQPSNSRIHRRVEIPCEVIREMTRRIER